MADMIESREAEAASTNLVTRAVSMLLRRDDCTPQPGVNLCEKPSISSNATTWIIVGVAIGALVIGTLAILLFLHLRRKKRDRREDLEDRYQNSDYGLDELPTNGSTRAGATKKPRVPTDDDAKWSSTDGDGGSPHGYDRRRSRDPLQVGAEPKYGFQGPGQGGVGGQGDGYLNPFDDGVAGRGGQSPRVGEGR